MDLTKLLILATLAGIFPWQVAVARNSICADDITPVSTTPVIEQSAGRFLKAEAHSKLNGVTDVLIIGDSIAEGWRHTQMLDFEGLSVVNAGIGGERTQELRWRLIEKRSDLNPRHIVVSIGTNNLADKSTSACEISIAIHSVIGDIRFKWPSADIYLLPILPRGADFRFRDSNRMKINELLSDLDNQFKLVEVNERALTCDETSSQCKNFQLDKLHLTGPGYAILRDALRKSGL